MSSVATKNSKNETTRNLLAFCARILHLLQVYMVKEEGRDAPILLFFHLFFFPAILFFSDPFSQNFANFAHIIPISETCVTAF